MSLTALDAENAEDAEEITNSYGICAFQEVTYCVKVQDRLHYFKSASYSKLETKN
jgi:hypothetical protein